MRTALVVVTALLVGAATAQAKIPPFEVEVLPESPIAGEPFQIVVKLEQAIPVEVRNSLIGLYPIADADQRLNRLHFRLGRLDDSTYHAEVTIDEPGEWVIIAFPNRTGWSVDQVPEGYPDRIPVTVRPAIVTGRLIPGLLLALLGLVAGHFIVSNRSR